MAKKKKPKTKILLPIFLGVITTLIILVISIVIFFSNRIYPNIYINSVNVSGKTFNEVNKIINPSLNIPVSLTLTYNGKVYQIDTSLLNLTIDKESTINKAYNVSKPQHLISLLTHKVNYPIEINYDQNVLQNNLDQIANSINIYPKNGVFTVSNGKVTAFQEDSNGQEMDVNKLQTEINNALQKNTTDPIVLEIPVNKMSAQIKTSDINNLGIKELIGSGTSHFAGSIATRVYNIGLAASRINNTLIAPGDIFSFDKTVGDISSLSGYKQAYIIQNGQTVLGDGGGVCQVSTTMFRAAMNTGLPITERHAHAYQVHYYEEDAPAGLDATIYSPTVDFKFKNDTGNYILIESDFDAKNEVLTFNFYGTSDGRVATISKPKLWGYSPAPDPLYTDDPDLPVGTIQQVDFAATGLKSQFDYTVTKDGNIINQQTFYSNYQPWQAKYLRGTKTS
ncbi:MAG TPA: VanW family protein [Patescibacteria group bacterium]|nr:VanW family protein [Patescibacteria group bacterium]